MTWHKVTEYVAHDITAVSSKAISLWLYLPQVILVIKVLKTIEGAGKRINSLKISNYSSHNLRPVFHETDIIPASKVFERTKTGFLKLVLRKRGKWVSVWLQSYLTESKGRRFGSASQRTGTGKKEALCLPCLSLFSGSLPLHYLCRTQHPIHPSHPRSTFPGKRSSKAHLDSRCPPCSKQFQPGRGK